MLGRRVHLLEARERGMPFIDTFFNFPTLSEAYKMAAYDAFGRLAKRGVETSSSTHAQRD